uniref:Uncharacterized protein n=1 Tax=Nothobranchius korthausae TaxID=1143690 RepID=A0A1A8H459_9TELE
MPYRTDALTDSLMGDCGFKYPNIKTFRFRREWLTERQQQLLLMLLRIQEAGKDGDSGFYSKTLQNVEKYVLTVDEFWEVRYEGVVLSAETRTLRRRRRIAAAAAAVSRIGA